MKFVTISSKGQIIIPSDLRKKLNWKQGTQLVFEETKKGILIKALDQQFLDELIDNIHSKK
jgi:AbrB family looped-hinge helix DNA binding protein